MHNNYDQPQVALHAHKHNRFFKFKFSRNTKFIANVVKVRTLSHFKVLDNTINIVLTPQRVGLTLIIMAQNSKTIKLETDYLIVGGGAMGMNHKNHTIYTHIY